MKVLLTAVLVIVVCLFLRPPVATAGTSPWEAVSLSVGLSERWLTNNAPIPDGRELEGIGNAALSLTPHVSVTGGLALGLQESYVRGYVDARITASDATDPNFNIWLGAGRYFSRHPADGLDEWAGKAGLGWRPMPDKPIVFGLTSGYGLDSGRRTISVSAVYAFKITRGAQ